MKKINEKTLNDIPVEECRCLGEMAMELLTKLFNKILENERIQVI